MQNFISKGQRDTYIGRMVSAGMQRNINAVRDLVDRSPQKIPQTTQSVAGNLSKSL